MGGGRRAPFGKKENFWGVGVDGQPSSPGTGLLGGAEMVATGLEAAAGARLCRGEQSRTGHLVGTWAHV